MEQKPIVNELKEEYADEVDIQYLDVYDVIEEAQSLNITAVPTLVFYDSEGNVLEQNIGSMDKESLKAKLDEIKGK